MGCSSHSPDLDLVVRQVSANVSVLLGMAPEILLGRSFETVLGPRQFTAFQTQVLSGDTLSVNPFRVRVGGSALEMRCVTHRQANTLIVELELLRGAHSLEPRTSMPISPFRSRAWS